MKEEVDYFVGWVSGDNEDKPNMPYLAARREYMYRVFRDDYKGRAEPVTEAMTYQEAKRKLEEIVLLTRGSNHE